MEVIKLHELSVFAACFFAGAVTGMIFDVFRAIRRCFKVSDTVVAVHDMLFWLIACVVVYMAIYLSNSAELRWFELVGLMAGVCLYMLNLSRRCIKLFCILLKGLFGFLNFMLKPVIIPLKAFVRLCSRLVDAVDGLKRYILCNLHKVFLKASHKTRIFSKNICKKFFFTFLKR